MEENWSACWVVPACSSELSRDDALDVFKEHEVWLALSDAPQDVWEEMAWVLVPPPFSCGTEWLTREASREDVHKAAKAAPWEGSQIRPYRCCVQESRFHLRDQIRTGEGFDLTSSDRAQASDNAA